MKNNQAVLLGVAVCAIAAVLLLIMQPQLLQGGKPAGLVTDVTGLKPGELMRLENGDRHVWVYRRTQAEIKGIHALNGHLVDPLSAESKQPTQMRNRYRSLNKEYFVFYPMAQKADCPVKYSGASEFGYDELYINAPVHEYGHFHERCKGNLFDTAGRVLKTSSYTDEVNLAVPEHEWLDPRTLLLPEAS